MRQTTAGTTFLLLCIFPLSGRAQQKADAEPILEARDISQGCCEMVLKSCMETTFFRLRPGVLRFGKICSSSAGRAISQKAEDRL